MSSDDAGQVIPQTGGQTATHEQEIETFFNRTTAAGYQPRLRYIAGMCLFNIAGAGSWRVTIADGVPSVTQGGQNGANAAPADCTVACSAEDFLRVVHREGNLNLLAAFLQGLVTITGDIGFGAALLGSATLDTVGSAGAQQR